jgi:aminoglycoside phosphotransferase (APT) family kinase protein
VPEPRHTADDIRSVLGTRDRVELILASDEFDTWSVGVDRIVKVARTPMHAEKVPRERQLHPFIGGILGSLVPKILADGAIEGDPFLVYERARGRQGQTIDGASVTPRASLATSVGATFARLHAADADAALEAGAGNREIGFDAPSPEDRTIERAVTVAGAQAVERFLAAAPPAPSERRALCHADVKGEHLFVDEAAGRLTGIIDWADTDVCDPARDYAGLVIWLGARFTRAAVAASGEDDPTLGDRAIWLGRVALLDYWDGVLTGAETAPIPLITEQLRVAFSD